MKKLSLSGMRKVSVWSVPVEKKLDRLLFLMGNMTNNLNQIAKYVNTVKKVVFFDLTRARMIIFRAEKAIEEFFNRDKP